MRFENVVFEDYENVKIKYLEVESWPFHWKNAITLIWVIKGNLKLNVESETYVIREGEVELINENEVFSIESISENKVIMMEVKPGFFESYYEGAEDVFFYTNLPDDDIWDSRYEKLREFMARILFEVTANLNDREEAIDGTLIDMMYHLLNNFHYLYSDDETLMDDEEEKERYHRIVKYLYNNYNSKVSLQDIAEKEFLSAPYLSQRLKETLGQGFIEYLNQIRSEESTKLLLDSDMNISQISEEVGFSHVRYYNKHFKLNYGISPNEYRRKYRMSDKEYREKTVLVAFDLKDAIHEVETYLINYARYAYDKRIYRVKIDMSEDAAFSLRKPNTVNLGDATLLLEEKNRKLLRDMVSDIGFKNGIIENLFSNDMDIYRSKNERFINWTRVENILDFLLDIEIQPIISHKGVEKHIIDDFKDYFYMDHDEDVVDSWLDSSILPKDIFFLPDKISEIYDRPEFVEFLFNTYISEKREPVLKFIDEINRDIYLENDTFFGGSGLITNSYLKKPAYFAMCMLAELGEDVISCGEDYVVTRSENGIEILLYNAYSKSMADISAHSGKLNQKRYSLNIMNMDGAYQFTRLSLSHKNGSIWNKWVDMGSPEWLSSYFWNLLDRFERPEVSFGFTEPGTVFNIKENVPNTGAVLYLLRKID